MRDADRILGMKNVKLIHANDSKTPLGSRVDRHENIGQGHIGADGFRRILAHPKLTGNCRSSWKRRSIMKATTSEIWKH